jgi:uncharacterized membrane protein HdeD (DUF308 family)
MWFIPLVATWAILTGALELIGAVRLRNVVNGPMAKGEWLLAATGIVTLALGVAAAVQPDYISTTFTWILAGYGVVSGALLLALGLNVRSWNPLTSA